MVNLETDVETGVDDVVGGCTENVGGRYEQIEAPKNSKGGCIR